MVKVFSAIIIYFLFCGTVLAQSFSCSMFKTAACLDFDDKVVSSDAMCFSSYQCDYEGFTCKSNVTDCYASAEELRYKFNNLVNDYNDLSSCVNSASNLAEAQSC